MSEQPKDLIPGTIHKTRRLYGICYRFSFWELGKYSYLLYQKQSSQKARLIRWQGEAEELLPFILELPSPESLKEVK